MAQENLNRTILATLEQDLESKIILLSGPRQVGKTTLAKALFAKSQAYLNYDRSQDRSIIMKMAWQRNVDLVIFDELHKMKKWKRWIKGLYDTEGVRPRLLVTGSARMDSYRSTGDSLAGRHFAHRLHPFSVAEVRHQIPDDQALELLLRVGGFPEPFTAGTDRAASRWRRTHLDRILREDLLDLEQIRNVKSLEILVDLLAERVGKSISFASLAQDLEVSPHTIKRWITLLENLFVIFVVPPYSKNIARAILKEPKVFFYDTGRVISDPGARLENVVACALLKRQHFLEDTEGETRGLFYIRDKQKREVDFLTTKDKKPEYLIEVKSSDSQPTSALRYYTNYLKPIRATQVVHNLPRELQIGGIEVVRASRWLAELEA